MTVQPIILAAGKGTRMGDIELPKVLVPLKGKSLISYQLETLAQTNFLPPALVVGHKREMIEQELGDKYTYITQEQLLGTGHALAICREALAGTADVYMVMYADNPLLSRPSMERLVETHQKEKAVLTLATLTSDNPIFHNFGRILRDEKGDLLGIREVKDCSPKEESIQEVNPGLYCFSDAWLWDALATLKPANAQNEYYLTDLVAIALDQQHTVAVTGLESWQEGVGINSPDQLALVESYLD